MNAGGRSRHQQHREDVGAWTYTRDSRTASLPHYNSLPLIISHCVGHCFTVSLCLTISLHLAAAPGCLRIRCTIVTFACGVADRLRWVRECWAWNWARGIPSYPSRLLPSDFLARQGASAVIFCSFVSKWPWLKTVAYYRKHVCALWERIKSWHKAAVADGFATATFLNTKQAQTWSAFTFGSWYPQRISFSVRKWMEFSNHEGVIFGMFLIFALELLLFPAGLMSFSFSL